MVERISTLAFRRKTRVSFAIFLGGMSIGLLFFALLRAAAPEDGLPWPLRKMLKFNAAIGEKFVSPERTDRAVFSSPMRGNARVNGDVGLDDDIDAGQWRLGIESPSTSGLQVSIDELKGLARTEVTSEFKCIEGWSEVMSFAGVSFRDFLMHYHTGTKSGQAPDFTNKPFDLYRYVGLETPDGEYYVSIDMKSMLNPQVLLAYEQNGEPLTKEHGAPLRLYMPNKYGVKSLKRVGKITFSDEPMDDFWGERGYDWFIGL